MYEELKKKIQKLEDSKYPHLSQINEWERELKLMNVVINQKSKLTDKGNESISLVKTDKHIRGKVSYFGKPVWCHIGSLHMNGKVHTDKLIGKMSDDELCDEFRYKLSMKIKTRYFIKKSLSNPHLLPIPLNYSHILSQNTL